MSTLVPEVQFSDFKQLTADQLKRLNCCEIFSDGEYLFTFMRPSTDFIRMQSENNGQLSNSVGGESLEKIIQTANTGTLPNEPELYVSDKLYKSKRKKRH